MLLFDFDGVLIDSLDEVTVSSYNAAAGTLKTALEQIPPGIVRLFRRNRHHVQPAGDHTLLMQWCIDNALRSPDRSLSAEEYREVIYGNDRIPLFERTRHFYAVRERFVQTDFSAWTSLHAPYQPLWDTLCRCGGRHIVILTHKNRQAVQTLCAHFNLTVLSENIYAGDHGVTKLAHLEQIHKRFGQREYMFIEDSVNNLMDLHHAWSGDNAVLVPILASWGYVGPRSAAQARKHGFQVLRQEDLVSILVQKMPLPD